jgi:Spy/CpxP family protein refolding chaperone
MTFRHSARRPLTYAAAALLAFGLGTAYAQPVGPGPGHGPGPMGHGPMLEQTLQALKGKLALNTMQQTLWDNAVAQGSAARDSGKALMQKVKDAMAAELAKPEPNLAAVAAVADDAETQGRTLRHAVRDQWLQLYATFSADQKAIVRDALQQKLTMMESFAAKMRARHGG